MNSSSSYQPSTLLLRLCLMVVIMLTFATPPAKADIVLNKIYGGGKQGAVGIGNVSTDVTLYTYYTQEEANTYNAGLSGAISASVALDGSQVDINKINTVLGTSYTEGQTVTAAEAITYNATLDGAVKEGDRKAVVDPADVKMANASEAATEVTIATANIVAVFGGGENGRSYGKTGVNIEGGTIGVDASTDTANGNVFGAGDGASAVVFGGSELTVTTGTIKKNAYGGGNEANLVGTTTVDLKGGTFEGSVFGGAKIADIYGRTFVNINGAEAVNNLHIVDVYGGNDVSGTVSPSTNANWSWVLQANLNLPFTLASTNLPDADKPAAKVNNTWNAFIKATKSATHKILIDNLYGGGNGDYDYTSNKVNGEETNPYAGKSKPVIDRTYLEIQGGVYGNLYGGGNAATVTQSTDICLLNEETIGDYTTAINALADASKSLYSTEYQFNRVFGGNNKEPMAIRPTWYLDKASINNLYSGGNAGAMTYFKEGATAQDATTGGICIAVESSGMTVNNVYGGCRMADVDPGNFKGSSTKSISSETLYGTTFQTGYAARVLIKGGTINNVYGGNDVSGDVYYGSQVEILSSINGDVYGAGNGSYAYTDKVTTSDYYYTPGTNSVEALNKWRPNAEKAWVHVKGTDADHPTYVGGSLYCGGNSATLRTIGGDLSSAKAHLQIGSHVVIDKAFLGSNGANMITSEILSQYKGDTYSSLDLTDKTTFDKYMEGVEVAIQPEVAFDAGYEGYSAKFGSLYCGGNVGSMSADGLFTVNFLNSLVIYDKLVAGSNSANVAKSDNNAFHMGGIIGAPVDGKKIQLNIAGLKLEPKKLTGNVTDGFTLVWNYTDNNKTMLQHANIYGGCYNSGYINGGVDINITEKAYNDFSASGVTYEAIRDNVLASTLSAYGGGYGAETEIWGNTNVNITENGQILKAYGGGEMGVVGKLQRNEDGIVQKNTTFTVNPNTSPATEKTVESFETVYNTTVTLNAPLADGVTNAAKVYGGGFQGLVSGNTTVNLNQGRVYDAFGGASNADILGTANMFVGKNSAPEVTHNVYGANDFGGQIAGRQVKEVTNVTSNADTNGKMQSILCQSYVEYNSGKILGSLFGGPCGSYDYDSEGPLKTATQVEGFNKPYLLNEATQKAINGTSDYGCNSFVNVISQSTLSKDVVTGAIYGAGEGLKGKSGLADEAGSYVRLASASVSSRKETGALTPAVYGAGYCSVTSRSLVDAFEGYYEKIFGGCYGITIQERITLSTPTALTYMGNYSTVRLNDMVNANLDIYGAGANSGTKESGVVLYAGQAQNVYGASLNEGITYAANVEVPESSTTKVTNIFGGAKGASDAFPCDAFNTYVTYNGANARVNGGIYGGNHNARVTRNACVTIHKPVKNNEEKLGIVFGGGLGESTVTLYTEVIMETGAQVANVYGGGQEGKVLDTPSFRYYLETGKTYTNTDGTYGYQHYLGEHDVIAFHDWIDALHDAQGNTKTDQNGAKIATYQPDQHGHTHDIYHLSTQQAGLKNTNVYVEKGAVVSENAYGGGLGATAQVSGETSVYLHGGNVQGDIYGGGNAGPVIEYSNLIIPDGITEITESATNVYLGGGSARNVFGGGLGSTASVTGTTNVVLGLKDQGKDQYPGSFGTGDYSDTYIGDACVERSLYGGGQQGAVYGATNVILNQGHIGYIYKDGKYEENVDLKDANDGLLKENGNVFGGGYGEGALSYVTFVTLYGGTIRNGLYGGGEIAAVGEGTMKTTDGSERELDHISVAGRTHIYIYNGLVQGDVFGGGRGFSYDFTGNEVVGKTVYTDGYVFGSTDVNIRGGEIGTDATVKDGHGNVFGGGNIGYVYSDAKKATDTNNNKIIGRYYTNKYICNKCHAEDASTDTPEVCTECHRSTTATQEEQHTTFTAGLTNVLSEDTRVVVSPWAQVTAKDGITINGTTYHKGDYVPTTALNQLKNKNEDVDRWAKISLDGVTIHNAVFAGGNVSAGSDKVYANAITVFGNATATINDVFNRDLISLGTDNIGGLYGDGNLTFVDGYRELNITSYGTDYYGTQDYITLDAYNNLNDRERAYFKLEYQNENKIDNYTYYKCNTPGTYGGVTYVINQHMDATTYSSLTDTEKSKFTEATSGYEAKSRVSEDEYKLMTASEKANWTPYGFCSIYAGRIMNTIQRADFCGVFGSRLVLQGAQDRVPEVIDYTQYTINRVGEVSLNKKTQEGNDSESHGNYFGLYNIVNYLGALTSDVKFDDVRTYDNSNGTAYAPTATGQSYWKWKVANRTNKKRNNGTCHNMVALASGVYLEIVQEQGSTKDNKNYGYVTGVIQLDLINVMPGLGGGYVYAKNAHGVRSAVAEAGIHKNLSTYNLNAVNQTGFTYDENNRQNLETTGNFIHKTKQIVDDCFPGGNQYMDYSISPAHYWYIRGETYVYDQYISAYTGSSNAYMEDTDIPLTITAGAHGQMTLLDIKPNYYAFYDDAHNKMTGGDNKIVVNNITYALNDVISYWDYMQLSDAQKAHFIDQTYVSVVDYAESEGGATISAGSQVFSKGEYTDYIAAHPTVWDPIKNESVAATSVIRISNAVAHENGYVLTVDMTNPTNWNQWYCNKDTKINTEEYKALTDKSGYTPGPTYWPNATNVYGQHYYQKDDIVAGSIFNAYNKDIPSNYKDGLQNQASVAQAYVALTAAEYNVTENGQTVHKNVQEGVGISFEDWKDLDAATKAKFEIAYTCTTTYEVDKDKNDYIYYSTLISTTKYNALKAQLTAKGLTEQEATNELNSHFDNAYIVTKQGNYGGRLFEQGKIYRALDAWAALSAQDRTHFHYDYDALDVLVEKDYPGTGNAGGMGAYDGGWSADKPVYNVNQPVDYMAKYEGDGFSYTDATGNSKTIHKDDELTRTQYESLPNEQHHYSSIKAENTDILYIVKEAFGNGGTSYGAGKTIDVSVYNSLNAEQKAKVVIFAPTSTGTYYFCRSGYTIENNDNGHAVTPLGRTTEISKGSDVPAGTIISEDNYKTLTNCQKGFIIYGSSPIETSTLYVSSESDIYDLSKDRVITVVYQYKYEESDESGMNIEEIIEKHVLNIHVQFKSGVPTVGQLQEPSVVLPGQTVGLKQPTVTEGAYTLLGGGWEMYASVEDANKHQNGIEYLNNATKMYWYQDKYYVSYYAKTYLGKTYSNSVPFHVANYHDIADVMADTDNYMYVDNPNVGRNSKIYIDNSYNEENPTATKTELDMLYDLFQTSLASSKKTITVNVQKKDASGNLLYWTDEKQTETTTTPTAFPYTEAISQEVSKFDEHARNCENLEFYVTSDLTTKKADWQTIGSIPTGAETDAETCFRGIVHGNGHTVSGLNNSLFENLCGYVYNLGVTGSFTKSGVADKVSNYSTASVPDGFAQNCWIHTTATPDAGSLPVVGVANDVGNANKMHVFNCYVPKEDGYTIPTDNANKYATVSPMSDFNNGKVAFNLNGFYLYKRYADNYPVTKAEAEANSALGRGGSVYKYWNQEGTGALLPTPTEAYYKAGALYPHDDKNYGYVEHIYADGDYVYAKGTIPETKDVRYYTTDQSYYPIWPDDYLFFGQRLTYGYDEANRPYQEMPSASTKTDNIENRLVTTNANVVFRAPAYYRDNTLQEVHFNPGAVFADHVKDKPTQYIHHGLTAIDFTGCNDVVKVNAQGNGFDDIPSAQAYSNGNNAQGIYFAPVLNFTTLLSFETHDITQNLLTYAPSATDGHVGHANTNQVLTEYFREPVYTTYYGDDKYRKVDALSESVVSSIHGHIVQKNGGYVAHTDHFLVDKQDFNAPLAYSFDNSHRMWYQRKPNYVDDQKGWEGVSIPFEAELVTTQDKGEITHFYKKNGSTEYTRGYDSGHEYWLRGFTGTETKQDQEGNDILVASMTYPTASGSTKTDANTFLWDYYYNADGKDGNNDDYRDELNDNDAQRKYYGRTRTYENYPLGAAGMPYIAGFPGSRYYEFDLSGTFVPQNSGTTTPLKLGAQTITFVSVPGIDVAVSTPECVTKTQKQGDYNFCPNYLSVAIPNNSGYVLNAEGSSFEKSDGTLVAEPFRPYFKPSSVVIPLTLTDAWDDDNSHQSKKWVQRILIGSKGNDGQLGSDENGNSGSLAAQNALNVFTKRGVIIVESTLASDTEVTVTNTTGAVLYKKIVASNSTEKFSINTPGIYIVNHKKVYVR